jgi:hypothetical protein
LERETGVEPATSSLGKRPSNDNKEHSVFVDLFLAIEFSQFSFWAFGWRLTVFKRCSKVGGIAPARWFGRVRSSASTISTSARKKGFGRRWSFEKAVAEGAQYVVARAKSRLR